MENRNLAKVYIVDDDPGAMALLKRMLEDYAVEIIGATDDIEKATADIIEQEPDLLFLDVEMPEKSGLELCTYIRRRVKPDMKIIFYTGYDKYLLEALRREAFDYMLKPASKQELAKIMTRYYENKLSTMQPVAKKDAYDSPIIVIVNPAGEHMLLQTDDIAFFRFNTERRLWEVVTTNDSCFLLRHRTTAETILHYSNNFVQIHKSYIVNTTKIQKIQGNQCILKTPMTHLKELKISKNYRHDLMSTFYDM